MKSPTIRELARTEKPLVLSGAHDALSEEYTKIVRIERWRGIERRFGQDRASSRSRTS